jgi:hypothetical protein
MTNRTKITNDKFSVRICQIANNYGFITIGKFHKFLLQCKPTAKLGLGNGHIRAAILLKEVESDLKTDREQYFLTGW